MTGCSTLEDDSIEQLKQKLAALQQRVTELEKLAIEGEAPRDELNQHLQEQTAELIKANEMLQHEMAERKRAEIEIAQINRQLLTLQMAGAALTSSLDLQDILHTVTLEMTNLLAVEACAISDWDKLADTVSTIAGYSQTAWWENRWLGYVFDLSDFPLTKKVLVERQVQQFCLSQPDIDPAELALMQRGGVKTLLMLPMIFQEQVIGLVEVTDSRIERKFSDQEVALAQLLANQAAGAIENARLYQAERDLRLERERSQQQERLAAVGQLAAGIAHDFNNILTTVIGFAELLQLESGLSESARKDLQRIVYQGQRGARLIRQILDFSRQTITTRRPMDLAPFLKESIKLLQHTIPENIQLALGIDPGEYMFNADAAQIQQILTNLALNAWDAMPVGGVLSFKLSYLDFQPETPPPHPGLKPGRWIVLAVSDTGVGISPETLSHIFEPFFTTKDVNKGTGLGLAQVDGIVKQHEGQIYVESQVGRGTIFTIYFPPLPAPPPIVQSAISAGNRELILVVEDDPNVLTVTQKLLEHLGYQILTAMNGRQALELYEQYTQKVALLLADVTMPEMGGVELFQAIHQRNPAIKAILMTGYLLEEDDQTAAVQGEITWLQKPLNVEQLARVVSQTLHPDRANLSGLQG